MPGKLKGGRKESLYNAVLHDRSTSKYTHLPVLQRKLTYYSIGGNMAGRSALPDLARETAGDKDWKSMDPKEERLIEQLCEHKAEKAERKVTKVSRAHTANDIEATMQRMNAEVSRLRHEDLTHYLTAHSS